ncbi:MAG: TRZ/ATZ family protein [Acholeplasmataceae bacterium]|nr:TRZ/ATZ family protein [Acholeplasmataceae bacterium]
MIKLTTPVNDETRLSLRVGDEVLISGTVYIGRDQVHRLLVEAIQDNQELPIPFVGQIIYYVGPTPAKPGQPIGACGPTSSYRMDPFSKILMSKGLKIMIGKGDRSAAFKQELIKEQAVYLIGVGGIGALMSKRVKKATMVAFPELQSEAIYKLEVEDFPTIVAYDAYGGDIFNR